MSQLRHKLSQKNPYYISEHRYYELEHFCRQYPEWEREERNLFDGILRSNNLCQVNNGIDYYMQNPTSDIALKLYSLHNKMQMVYNTCLEADEQLYNYIFMGVTRGLNYENLLTVHNIPCSRNTYYDRYHKYFWLLDKVRE